MSLAVVSTVVAAAMIAVMSPVAQMIGLVDRPNARKTHLSNVPLVGGLGIFISFMAATFVVAPQSAPGTAFLLGSLVLVFGGVLDDFFDVSPYVKFSFQLGAVLTMCLAGGVVVRTLGEVLPGFSAIELGILAVPFTLVAAVGVINAVNLYDGLDGLAGFQLLVAFSALAFLAQRAGAADANELVLLAGSVVGFLIFNARALGRKQASVFLGDAGTMFLGFTYVWYAIDFSNREAPVMAPVTALWLLAIPICDAVTMFIRRVSRGRSPFKADKEHLHHVFLMAGFTVGETVMTLTGLAVMAAGIGIAGEVFGVSSSAMLLLFLLAAVLYLWIILRAWTVMRFLRWSICRRRAIRDRRANTERRRANVGPPAGLVERRSGLDRRRAARRKQDTAMVASGQVRRPREEGAVYVAIDAPSQSTGPDSGALGAGRPGS